MIDRPLPTHRLGYAIDNENHGLMLAHGMDPVMMLRAARENMPTVNVQADPMKLIDPLDQGNQGACQGHSLANCFAICYYLSTGRVQSFSRAAAYYLSQKKDGLRGDVGSTLSAGMWVATSHGLCLESDWIYPARYNPQEPPGVKYQFRLVSSRPTQDWELIREALDMGLPVQDGIVWNDEVSRTLVTNYTGRGAQGGHSTTLWLKAGENYRRINSWGKWDGDGCNENTPKALQQQVQLRGNNHVIYAPERMIYPELDPIG